jgi:hypothetical protein
MVYVCSPFKVTKKNDEVMRIDCCAIFISRQDAMAQRITSILRSQNSKVKNQKGVLGYKFYFPFEVFF